MIRAVSEIAIPDVSSVTFVTYRDDCIVGVPMVYNCHMTLNEYILQIGRKEAATLFRVSPGAISHWLTGRRTPSARRAKDIVQKTPVTWEGIYGGSK
jgi:hypothetical protein